MEKKIHQLSETDVPLLWLVLAESCQHARQTGTVSYSEDAVCTAPLPLHFKVEHSGAVNTKCPQRLSMNICVVAPTSSSQTESISLSSDCSDKVHKSMDGTNKSSHQRVFAWYFNFMVLGVVWIMPLIFTSLEVWQSPVQIKLGSGPLGTSKAENPRCNTWGWGYKLTGAYNIMAWIGHDSTSKTGYAARHQEVKYFGSCSQNSQSSSERPIRKHIRKTSWNMKHYETAQNCKKSDSRTQEVLLQSMNLTVRLITNSSARLAICSAFCWQPMTAKLLQAYLKLYTFAHCLRLYLLGPRTHPTLDLPVVLGAVAGGPSDLLSSLHILKEIRVGKQNDRNLLECTGKSRNSFQYVLTVSHSCGFIQCNSCWADHLGNLLADIPRKLRHALWRLCRISCSKENSEQVIASYHLSMHFHACKSTENSTWEHLEKLQDEVLAGKTFDFWPQFTNLTWKQLTMKGRQRCVVQSHMSIQASRPTKSWNDDQNTQITQESI